MPKLDLTYPAIKPLLEKHMMEGRTESKALLAWFLETYYHLLDTDVDDSICDEQGDKGVDGIFVNELRRTIDVFQSKIAQNNDKQLGDADLQKLLGALTQFKSGESVRHLAATTRSDDLRKLLDRSEIDKKVEAGYTVRGIFITNRQSNTDAADLLAISPDLTLYDRIALDEKYIPIDKVEPIAGPIKFSVSSVDFLRHSIDGALKMIIAPLAASELVKMEGISNLELFRYNLRYDLKSSPVNRDIEASVQEPVEHRYFPAFHNGLTVLCETLEVKRKKITITGYAVVNGCQSLNALYHNQASITPDLRILTKFLRVSPNSELAQKITDRTNNQNAIIGRDRQSNSEIQNRLQSEIHKEFAGEMYYRIARGEHPEWDANKVIENDQMARVLLAFNLKRPESCHQHYKLFNDLHEDIFGHPDVTADRVVALHDLDQIVLRKRAIMQNKPFCSLWFIKVSFPLPSERGLRN